MEENTPYSFTPSANDIDSDNLNFNINNRPAWANFNTATGLLSGQPSSANVGSYNNIVISVSDGTDVGFLPAFSINVVSAPNTTPTISGTPAFTVMEYAAYSFVPTANDSDGDTLTFSVTNLPSWATFSSSTGAINGTPNAADTGLWGSIVISVSDGEANVSLPAFSITVSSIPNTAPTISGTPAFTVTENATYSFIPTANDSDGDTLTFSVTNLPSWTTFSSTTGAISGTPNAADAGLWGSIVISVSDGEANVSLPAFSITVSSIPNTAPTISGTPAFTVTENTAYSFSPTVNDADGDTLTFSVTNLPSWATFSLTTGEINGTPNAADAGLWSSIIISVSDGEENVSLPAFSITVSSIPNAAPTINGTPAFTVVENIAYSFTPTASDTDGDTLSFSVTNLPIWASFDPATGTLTGIPSSLDVGTTGNIIISVSDGVDSVSLPSFGINVTAVTTNSGTATLSWLPPTENTDGSTLTDLAGYNIYYGTELGNYTSVITIDNPGIAAYVVDNLPAGNTYYFVITAYTVDGLESEYSTIGSKTIL